jgi:hypothetical protein
MKRNVKPGDILNTEQIFFIVIQTLLKILEIFGEHSAELNELSFL